MNPRPQRMAALVLGLFIACVLGCKSGDKTSSSAASSPSHPAGKPDTETPLSPTNIAGSYNVFGTNPNGATYKGTLEVIAREDVYQFRWNAGAQYDGIGVVNTNFVAVAFANGSNGKGCGVIDYNIQGDGSLDGKWGYWGVNEAGTEKAARASGSGLAGEYDASGKNPDGKEYKATLTVEPAGNLHRFVWSNNTDGVGIKQGKNVAVGIGGPRCGFVAYEIKTDGTLEGVWGTYGSDKTGTETARKQ